jgi:predicted DCC family thiol-disulfide oxidoreductase YuxK
MSKTHHTEVLYNAACPVCSREIDHYAKITENQALQITYSDLNSADTCAAWNISPDQAARRLHVRKGNDILSGIPAFIALWQDIPRYRWLARVVGWPGVRQIATLLYDRVLAPLLYVSHQRRKTRLGL